jgi:hypothetical protein
VHHRHLLPNEIDLLIDEDSGFGVQPLREHIQGCADCRARVTEARAVVSTLSELPLLAPQIGLADRVMAKVPVFVPWHVAAIDAAKRLVPSGHTPRLVLAGMVATVGSVLTGLTLVVAMRGDILALLTGVVGERARGDAERVLGDAVVALFGPQVFQAVQQIGPMGIGLAAAGFVLAAAGTAFGLRLIATSGRARS